MLELVLDIILPLALCLVFVKNHLFAIIIYCGMLLLYVFNMTVMFEFTLSLVLIFIAIILFTALFYIERRWKTAIAQEGLALSIILAIIRFPVNFIYIQDIIFRFRNWVQINRNLGGSGVGGSDIDAAVGGSLITPMIIMLIFSSALLFTYIRKIKLSSPAPK